MLLVGVAWSIGSLVPREHVVSRAATFRATPEALYGAIAAVAEQPGWREEVESVEVLPPRDGKLAFREHSSMGDVTFVVEVDEPGVRRVVRIADEDLPYGGTWTFRLESREAGTRLTITEEGFVDPALYRFLGKFVFGYSSTIDGYLKALGEKFGEKVEPGPA